MTTLHNAAAADTTAVILAGGKARRMGGADKGLAMFHGKPLIEHVITALKPQVNSLIISANRNLERYREYGYPVVTDIVGDYPGPLAGIASGMQATVNPCILIAPCDAPFIPDTLAGILSHTLADTQADISVAHDGIRMQQLFALLRCELLPALLLHLEAGGRRVESWYRQQRLAVADFSDCPDAFANLNTLEDKRESASAAARPTGSSQVVVPKIVPRNPLKSPGYIRLKPISQYMIDAMPNSAMFLVNCIATFLDRTRPASSIANPAAIKNTRNPATKKSKVVRI